MIFVHVLTMKVFSQKNLVNPIPNNPFKNTVWILCQEFDPSEDAFIDLPKRDTVQFLTDEFKLNGSLMGCFHINQDERKLSLKLTNRVKPAFALYKLDDAYNFRYKLDEKGQLLLFPLDEREEDTLITVEGKTLLFVPHK